MVKRITPPVVPTSRTMVLDPGVYKHAKLLLFAISVATSAAVSNRYVTLEWRLNNDTVYTSVSPVVQTAGTTQQYLFAIGVTPGADVSGSRQFVNIPDLVLPPGLTLVLELQTADAGDSWSNAVCVMDIT